MKELAPDLFMLSGLPPAAFNVYAIRSEGGWILIDTATRYARRRILRQSKGEVEAILITHAHRDHAGSMKAIARATGAPVWAGAPDADALEGKVPPPAPPEAEHSRMNRVLNAVLRWDRHPVARRLSEGERIGDWEVIAFPGHTPGQIGLWRESDRTVVCADTMRTVNVFTGLPQIGEMPELFTVDVSEARRSIRKLAALEPRVACFGHGRPMIGDAAEKINAFAASLPVEHPTP
jgi:glyoxylase-like metal-dependent hydrolase (beta-lactamase superfamily II)